MSVLPEVILQRALRDGLQTIRNSPKLLNTIFYNLSQKQQEDVKEFVLKQPISFYVNYPRTDIKVPAIIMTLQNESEDQTYLGNHMGTTPDYGLPETFSHDVLGSGYTAASISDTSGLPKMVCGPLSLDGASSSSVTLDTGSITAVQEFLETIAPTTSGNFVMYVVSGTGAGYSYSVSQFNSDSIDIEGSFTVQLDNQSVIVIRDGSDTVKTVGEPSRFLNQNSIATRYGVDYGAQYQLEIIAGHQEQALYLYALVKIILISQTPFLEGQGLKALKLSGSDFAPKSDYLPTDVFSRALTLQFTYAFSYVEELITPTRILVKIYPNDEDTLLVADFTI